MTSQLSEMQENLELIVSLLVGDDAKKGEMVLKSKCSPQQTLKKDNYAADGGNKGGTLSSSNRDGKSISDGKSLMEED